MTFIERIRALGKRPITHAVNTVLYFLIMIILAGESPMTMADTIVWWVSAGGIAYHLCSLAGMAADHLIPQ